MVDPGIDSVEQQIREAQARGEFDNLPGAGKPLRLGSTHDPDWWVKGLIEREQLDMTGALPGAIGLRKEAEPFPQSLADERSEETVRKILADFNRRVKRDRLRTFGKDVPQIIAPTVDIDQMVRRWAQLRHERSRVRETAPAPASVPTRRRRWPRRR